MARVAYEVSKNLVSEGHEVTVYTTDGFKSRLKINKNKPVDVDGINTYYFRNLSNYLSKNNITIPYYLPFIAIKKIKDFDIIHIHEHRTLLAIITHYYAKKYNVPYILQAHGSIPTTIGNQNQKRIFDTLWGNKILKGASKLIAVSNIEVNQYKQIGVPDEKIVNIPNGIDIESFKFLPKKGTFKQKYNISEKHVVLFLGRLNKIKGIDFLIKSYAELASEVDDLILVLAGPDDGFKDKAELLISQLNLNNVKFIGYISGIDKFAAYLDADVLVYPSSFEIFGLVPFEAIMCGTPVIVTDNCGCGELIKESRSGYIIKYGDVNSLKEKMRNILKNPQRGNEFVDNGKKFVYENLSLESTVKKIEKIYSISVSSLND